MTTIRSIHTHAVVLRSLALSVLAALALVACKADESDLSPSILAISTERYGGSKMAVDRTEALWSDGDTIRINARTSIVHRKDTAGTTLAYISAADAATQGSNRALFPHSLAASALTGDAVSVSLPRRYTYRTDATGRQLLPMPMAACEEAGRPLVFRHLTGALRFRIVNSLSVPIAVDSLVVESDGYALSGSLAIDFSHLSSIAPQAAADAADRRVSMLLGGATLAVGDSLCFVLPVAAVGADNHFTITVSARNAGTRYLFSRTQQAGGALERNMLGHAAVSMEQGSFVSTGSIFNHSTFHPGDDAFYHMYISSASEFLLLVQAINEGWTIGNTSKKYSEQNYELTADIDLGGSSIQPIRGFTGAIFDGQGHSLSNMQIVSFEKYCALFATATQISNLHLSNIHLRCTTSANNECFISPLVANGNSVNISNCSVSGYSIDQLPANGDLYIGGILGHVSSNTETTISGCNVDVALDIEYSNGYIHYGGIAGFANTANTTTGTNHQIRDNAVHDESTIIVRNGWILRYGGIVGSSSCCNLTNNSWMGDVQLGGSRSLSVGGLCGFIEDKPSYTITDCSVNGDINLNYNTADAGSTFVGYCIGRCKPEWLKSTIAASVTHDVRLNGEPLETPCM